jgi:hypothetical protein
MRARFVPDQAHGDLESALVAAVTIIVNAHEGSPVVKCY